MENFIYPSSTEFKQLSTLKVAIVVLRIAAHLLSDVAYLFLCKPQVCRIHIIVPVYYRPLKILIETSN